MGYTINALTGNFDKVKVPVTDVTTEPGQSGSNGDLLTGYVGSDGILYFRTNSSLYKLVGTQIIPVSIGSGEVIGFANYGITYANPVT